MNRKSRAKPAGSPVPTLAAKVQPKPYVPTEQESAAAQRILDRKKNRPPSPKFKIEYNGTVTNIEADHACPSSNFVLLADALSTGNLRFANGLLSQIANVAQSGPQLTASDLNFMLATIHEIGPKDPTETLLALQMAAVHNAVMVAARRLNHVENIPQQDSANNMLNKLARTYTSQIEALKKHRSTGEQNIRVQHVNVNAGQAIVGITQGGGGTHENKSQSHAPSPTDECRPALLSQEQALAMPLPSAGGEEPGCVPHARSPGGCANGEGERRLAARDGDK